MCYVYRVKAWMLTEYVRNLSLTSSLTFILQHLMTCHVARFRHVVKDKPRGWERMNLLEDQTVMCQTEKMCMKQYKIIVVALLIYNGLFTFLNTPTLKGAQQNFRKPVILMRPVAVEITTVSFLLLAFACSTVMRML